ncbi:MAG: hypothetical protein MJE77_13960, partial [Proteobacteria bacterium]|nr:hypothetical protein [Pseudomonadota bacterium]
RTGTEASAAKERKTQMNQYRLGRPLGYGGKTVVFEAWQLLPDESEEPVAIKRLLPEYRGDEWLTRLLC